MLTYAEALGRVIDDVTPRAEERVPFDLAVGRVLAEDVCASGPLPAFDYSAMDGYAVRAEDLSPDAPTTLRVEGESRTGAALPSRLEPGTACRIFTGARPPPGADAVVMQEEVTARDDSAVFPRRPKPGAHLRRAGEDVAAGSVVLARGTRVTAWHAGLLAAVEALEVSVARQPVVAIVSTGDELRAPGEPGRPGSVVDANGHTLAALVRHCGGLPRRLPFARDDLDQTRALLLAALQGADLVLTVGGVSVGDHDVVRDAMEQAGIALDFWRVAIKPGKPLALGIASTGQRVLGLPGNPASATLTFVLFGAPLLRAMQGDLAPVPPRSRGVLAQAARHAPGRLEFARATVDRRASPPAVTLCQNQASGSVLSFAHAQVLALLPAEVGDLAPGSEVEYLALSDV
ncbi:MAG: molybdopterin molybdotransferase MoeA [Deltaproteobacteria bacterium]|nr:molybdopterin molybdotransferase MoeA [Deltaproteobacteria bacterium]